MRLRLIQLLFCVKRYGPITRLAVLQTFIKMTIIRFP